MEIKSEIKTRSVLLDQQGQTIVEYILLLSLVVSMFMLMFSFISDGQFARKLTRPIREEFAMVYKYGHPKAKGYDEGTPKNHPRARDAGSNNFRMFINPSKQ